MINPYEKLLSDYEQYSDSCFQLIQRLNMHKTTISLYNAQGQRKYLNNEERTRFFEETKTLRTDKKLFYQLLYFTGARITEVHNLTPVNIDISNKMVVFETLKRRKEGIFREIPLPALILNELQNFISDDEKFADKCLWNFSLRTASRCVEGRYDQSGYYGTLIFGERITTQVYSV